ncbi:MAG: efflux RND transporter permease subunit [Gammaproteobacteria bacterium]|jgi:HAE1 family hydrophobic/amphiphilic exporter-1|nr:efflux RND transporter permease subunit [Gammaproteobacteria bacterium]
MNFSHFFIDRPRFAAVVSILITIVGAIAYFGLPVTQYPDVVPPTIIVTASYPGATPEVIADTVAAPIEQEINGVEGMLYLTSSSTSDGRLTLTITFELGTDLDAAQVLVQNRVAIAEPRLPEEVRRIGVVTEKSSPDLMIVVHLESPDDSLDQLYISNYALLHIRDVLARINGVGQINLVGAREYSMRVWLDPDRMAGLNVTADDVVTALRGQNIQVAGGTLGEQPSPASNAFQVSVSSQGRLLDAEQFGQVIVKSGADGRLTRVADIARVELGARDYLTNSLLDGRPAVALVMFQRPGSNALETAEEVKQTMAKLAPGFPKGLVHRIVYNPTDFIAQSVDAVYIALLEATALVIIVILLFLQNWRAAIIPVIAIPVSLIGTFAVMAALGYSLNNLTLFGLVLAIGIVVDDAIVVVESIERNLESGLAAREAARRTMTEVGTALVSIALVLVAVFLPTAFLGGISGQFFRQFAVTIATATAISALVSLTLSPALGAILLRRHDAPLDRVDRGLDRLLGRVFRAFNLRFDQLQEKYRLAVCRTVRRPGLALSAFAAMLGLTAVGFMLVPTGFIPQQDQGYLITLVELPKGASLDRTTEVIRRATDMALKTPGLERIVAFAGFSAATNSNASHSGTVFTALRDFRDREPGQSGPELAAKLNAAYSQIQEASLFVVAPPPVRGIGSGGDFKLMVQDRSGQGLQALEQATWALVAALAESGEVARPFSTFTTTAPRYFLDIDRTRAEMMNVPIENVFATLQIYLGSSYVNDLTLFGRNYRVTAQADAPWRLAPEDISRLRTRNADGEMVPLGSLVAIRPSSGPDRVVRHNLYPTAEVQMATLPGRSSGQILAAAERIAAQVLPPGIEYEWTDLAYQQTHTANLGLLMFPLSVLFVFLVLTAQYESWSLPFAIVLIVPLCLLFAIVALLLRGLDINILAQIGFIVLIGLASKNAILIVEFARQQESEGKDRFTAAIDAAQLRLRPILMTSFAFIAGVLPLMLATGAGAEMRQVLGTVVFGGMLGVTFIGLLLTPVFYTVIRGWLRAEPAPGTAAEAGPP